MKIERNLIPELTLEQFAVKFGLTMQISERESWFRVGGKQLERFYCCFKNVAIKEPGVLVGVCGNGDSEDEALADYASRISERKLAIGAYSSERKDVGPFRIKHVPK